MNLGKIQVWNGFSYADEDISNAFMIRNIGVELNENKFTWDYDELPADYFGKHDITNRKNNVLVEWDIHSETVNFYTTMDYKLDTEQAWLRADFNSQIDIMANKINRKNPAHRNFEVITMKNLFTLMYNNIPLKLRQGIDRNTFQDLPIEIITTLIERE